MKSTETLLAEARQSLAEVKQEAIWRRDELDIELVRPLRQQVNEATNRVVQIVNDEYGDRIEAAEKKVSALTTLRDNERINAAAKHPLLGQKVRQWRTRLGSLGLLYPTDELAVVDVFDGSNASQGAAWNRPHKGQLFLRKLRKDGTPGRISLGVLRSDKLPHGWYPVGVNPNEQ